MKREAEGDPETLADWDECARLEKELLTLDQRKFLENERAPRWDLDPPQREEFDSPLSYMLDLARYVAQAMGSRGGRR